jgi:hypothetical protein
MSNANSREQNESQCMRVIKPLFDLPISAKCNVVTGGQKEYVEGGYVETYKVKF